MVGAVRATLSRVKAKTDGAGGGRPDYLALIRSLAAFDRGVVGCMGENWGNWILDDWERAVQRSLTPKLSRRQRRILRCQWRIGQAVKGGVVVLGLLLGFSLLVADTAGLQRALLGWCLVEEVLLLLHIVLGLRYGVSYGWGLHHARPLLLSGLSAHHDLKVKGFLAAGVAVLLLQGLLALA